MSVKIGIILITAILINFVEVEGMSQEAACEILCPASGGIGGRARGRLPPPTRPPWIVWGRGRGQLPPPTRRPWRHIPYYIDWMDGGKYSPGGSSGIGDYKDVPGGSRIYVDRAPRF